jgi:hypothetical protein
MFHVFMTRTKQILRLPGAPDFEAGRRAIEAMIWEFTDSDCRSAFIENEMVRVTAVKWFVTIFVQEFKLPDVLRIWDYLIAPAIDGFEKRLAAMCGRVFTLLKDKIVGADGEEIMQQLSAPLCMVIEAEQLIQATDRGRVPDNPK